MSTVRFLGTPGVTASQAPGAGLGLLLPPSASAVASERRLAAVQALTRAPQPGNWDYPHVALVLALLDVDYPQENFRELEPALLALGIDDASKLICMPLETLQDINNIGLERSALLHQYAGYGVAPVIGLRGPVRKVFEGPDLRETSVDDFDFVEGQNGEGPSNHHRDDSQAADESDDDVDVGDDDDDAVPGWKPEFWEDEYDSTSDEWDELEEE